MTVLALVDDVVVGDDVAVIGDEEAGAEAHLVGGAARLLVALPARTLPELAEELLHRRIVAARAAGTVEQITGVGAVGRDFARRRLDANADHRRPDLVDDVGKADGLDAFDADCIGKGRGLRKDGAADEGAAEHHRNRRAEKGPVADSAWLV